VEPEPLIYREEVMAMLFGLADINVKLDRIVRLLEGDDGQEDAIFTGITRSEEIRRQVLVRGSIEAARFSINAQHYIDEETVLPLLQHSQFVADYQLRTYAKGIARFFQGDFVSATYVLTPLLENSLRHVLKAEGHDVTVFDDVAQTQQDRTISSLFEQMRTPLNDIFGEPMVDDLDRVFLRKPGPYLRHSLAHGLFTDNTPYGADAIYACWLIFHLCMLPLISHHTELTEWLLGTDLVQKD